MTIKETFEKVLKEIERIQEIHPNNNENTLDSWIRIIGEEYGEICRAVNDKEGKNLEVESIQIISAVVLMLRQYTKSE